MTGISEPKEVECFPTNYVLLRVKKWGVAVMAFLLCTPLLATASEQIPTSVMDEVVITATRLEERRFDVPTPIEVVTSETHDEK